MNKEKHKEIKAKILSLHDEVLSGPETAALQSHIESCTDCKETYANWLKMRKNFLQPLPFKPSPALVVNVMKEIHNLKPGWATYLNKWFVPTLSVSIATLMLVITLFSRPENTVFTESLIIGNVNEYQSLAWLSGLKRNGNELPFGILEEI